MICKRCGQGEAIAHVHADGRVPVVAGLCTPCFVQQMKWVDEIEETSLVERPA